MGNNRFTGVKTLKQLYEVFTTAEGVQYSNLSDEELERVAIVFEANIPNLVEMPDTPLTEAGYTYVWNVTVEEIETMPTEDDEKEDGTMGNSNNNTNVTVNNATVKEDGTMGTNQAQELFAETVNETIKEGNAMGKRGKAKGAVLKAVKGFNSSIKGTKVNFATDKENLIDNCDKSLNEIKNSMEPVLTVLDDALGCTALKEEICVIMYDTLNGATSANSFFRMATKCREAVDRKIKLISMVDPDDKLGKIAALRELQGDYTDNGDFVKYTDEDGNDIIVTQSIWMAFAKAIVWVCKKVTRKLRKWFGVKAEENVFGAAGASIAQAFAILGNIIKNAAKIAGTVLSYVTSYAVAGVIKLTQLVITAFKFVVEKLKGWSKAAKDKLTKDIEEDTQEEEEIQEELDEVQE